MYILEPIVPRKLLFEKSAAFEMAPTNRRLIERNNRDADALVRLSTIVEENEDEERTRKNNDVTAIYPLRQFSSIARVRSVIRARSSSVCGRRNCFMLATVPPIRTSDEPDTPLNLLFHDRIQKKNVYIAR